MQPKRVILDTDPGIDDALAILLALASPEIHLEAVTVTAGNCSLEQGVVNALAVLELAGASDTPVAAGVPVPLVKPVLAAPETHGDMGLGYAHLPAPRRTPVDQHAVDLIIERIMAAPKEITLVAVAPLTNIAMAIRREPRVVEAVREVIIMGGALRHQGNTTPLAEFNTYVDPHAAYIVYHSGMPITLTPLDVTYQCLLQPEDVNRLLATASPIAHFIADATRFYMEFHDSYQSIQGCAINDPLALALAFAPDLVETREYHVTVDIYSEMGLGNTVADFYNAWRRPPNVRAALDVHARRFMDLFVERMEQLIAVRAYQQS
jgi:purine nucleosidase